jgi:multiple sugar transport system ATP-binding protein
VLAPHFLFPGMASVSLRHLTKTYVDAAGLPLTRPALRDLSLEVADREFVVFVGPSGAGKSTLVRLIAGLEQSDAGGEILLGNQSIHELPAHRREVAVILRDQSLYPHLTVAENLAFALKMRGAAQGEIKKRTAEATDLLKLGPLLGRRPEDLSDVERQRVALGRAVVRQPKLLLLDEPLAGHDEAARLACRAELIAFHQRLQVTTIYVTRDPLDALTLADRLSVLEDGVVRQTGAPLNVYQQPEDLVVAGVLGRPPMNRVPGRLTKKEDRLTFKESGGGAVEVRLRATDRPALQPYAGQEIVLGVRPEDLEPVSSDRIADGSESIVQALVDYVERTGAETVFHLQTGQQALVARGRATALDGDTGRRARFRLDPARIHFFDPATGRRIV